MVRYICKICKRQLASPGGLTQHANAVHHGRKTLSMRQSYQRRRQLPSLPHDPNLWQMPATIRLPERPFLETLPEISVSETEETQRSESDTEMESEIAQNIEANESSEEKTDRHIIVYEVKQSKWNSPS